MAKSFTSSATLLDGLRQDILWLLILIYAHRERAVLPTLRTMSYEALALELVLLESATRDIIARLTALDDDGKGLRSFQSAFSAMKREGLEPERTRSIDKTVKSYRQLVNGLKVGHRNTYIAHVKEIAEVTPRIVDNPVEFTASASLAVNLLDEMIGKQVPYMFRIGSAMPPIDLREKLAGSP
ncbi:hypothetical protein ASG72_10940 [Bosea sp. Leaf344]|uniref:hypothetical protein n=1 Tax=Bosea sp. Leaf344 TaxID=1736346 RepID=UPI0006F28129|nr:hypothetical protein [Bosea sp. Leaf344]KQU51993.1 hypothetical protein ASG72_10940 [Bosea sp. Leaf344]